MTTVTVQQTGVSPSDVLAVARGNARVELSDAAVEAMRTSRTIVDDIERAGRPVYGVSTGFGALANTSIAPERRAELQHALIRSHAAGIGAPMPPEVVRAMILLRVRSLALGRSGVRPVVDDCGNRGYEKPDGRPDQDVSEALVRRWRSGVGCSASPLPQEGWHGLGARG